MLTRDGLIADLRQLGLGLGDIVMVHAAISRIGPVLGGVDTVIAALCEVAGTVMAYADWNADYEALLGPDGSIPQAWRDLVPGFHAGTSRAARGNSIFPEFLRTTPGALRSANPGASVVAIGDQAAALTADHPLDDGYGPGSPFARLVAAGGKVLMLGAPLDTITLLHHAEHLADVPGKRIKRVEVPFATPEGTRWRWCHEFDTADPVIAGLPDDYFGQILRDYLAIGRAEQGRVGQAAAVVVDASEITAFAVDWIEEFARR
ncbi:aminoglycoside 3-N-acetyltransferase [Ketogulonicigenium vulgare]|uniref:aminoglycoside 3-N-acetyltransferase n=1 Tax=Ketogulonicigenium vulgare TaxID=92945 RepID=UPI002359D26A|nr:aminoglycoside 3-N-acetyltransferase [Ketogulonicigenium vulgare]